MFTCKHPIGKEPEPQEMRTSDRSRITNLMWGRHAHRWRFSRLGGSIFRVVLLGLVVVVGVYAAEDQDPEPAVIRIGHQKQLFVDNFLLDTGLLPLSRERVQGIALPSAV